MFMARRSPENTYTVARLELKFFSLQAVHILDSRRRICLSNQRVLPDMIRLKDYTAQVWLRSFTLSFDYLLYCMELDELPNLPIALSMFI